jgi:hypothetical protein
LQLSSPAMDLFLPTLGNNIESTVTVARSLLSSLSLLKLALLSLLSLSLLKLASGNNNKKYKLYILVE